MTLFLLTFFLVYGGLHLYFFHRLRAAFTLPAGRQGAVGAVLLLLMAAPVLVRMAERRDYETAAAVLSQAGYLWMALLFLFFVTALGLEWYRLAVFLTGRIARRDLSRLFPPARVLFLAPLAAAVLLTGYGYAEALRVRTEHLEIATAKLPAGVERFRIVQLADVHVGITVRGERLKGLVAAAEAAAPDVLVSTGDLVDGQLDNLAESLAVLHRLPARYGKFAVTGNHEFYAGIDRALADNEKAGFRMLRGEAVPVAGLIAIAGVDDPVSMRNGAAPGVREAELLSSLPSGTFRVLLKHRPLTDRDAEGKFDLQLSGHTHAGQIFPFNLVTNFVFPFHRGDFVLPGGGRLHVSRGTGTWGPPVRLFAPPEVTVIDITPLPGGHPR